MVSATAWPNLIQEQIFWANLRYFRYLTMRADAVLRLVFADRQASFDVDLAAFADELADYAAA
jgi:hypothetical protein